MMQLAVQAKRWFFRNFANPQIVDRRGLRWHLDPRDKLQNALLAGIVYEAGKIKRSCELIEKLSVEIALDIGANFGLYSLFWAQKNPPSHIYAFEPVERTYASLARNVALNNFSARIQPFHLALGAEEAEMEISYNPRKSGGASLLANNANQGQLIREWTAVRPLDNILQLENRIIFAKMDVEGYVCKVLDGANSLLSSNKCMIQAEAGEFQKKSIVRRFDRLGYRHLGSDGEDLYFINFQHPGAALDLN